MSFAAIFAGAAFIVPAWLAAHANASERNTAAANSGTRAAKMPENADGKWKGKLPIAELSEDEAITHALNRLGYGPLPGDIERVKRTGLEVWITQQLHPESIDDAALHARLAGFPSQNMSAAELMIEYPRPDAAAKKLGITPAEYNQRMQDAMHPPQGQRPAADRRPYAIVNDLQMAKIVRAVYSERQLQQRLTDFWFNHFNVDVRKSQEEPYLLGAYEQNAIAPRVLGKFRDLLGATAHSPAMMIYLDNWLSADPDSFERVRHATPAQRVQWKSLPPIGGKRGLNENYGRELLELHTLGVDGGYTQADVIAVAKCFTGWSVRDPQKTAEFYFDSRTHVPGEKRVLGKKIHETDGEKEGEKVLDMLVKHPATAKHISYRLAEDFVSDNPPPELVARMAKEFERSKGDLREVMRAMIYSPEFWSRAAYGAKIKKPFDFVVSAARGVGADVNSPQPLVGRVGQIGEPLYQCLPPTGYKDNAATWVNTGALLNRLTFALAMARGQVRGTEVDLASRLGDDAGGNPKLAIDRAIDAFLGGQISASSRQTLEREMTDPQVVHARLDDPVKQVDLGVITGLVLGTPEFQRR